jgi:HK97 family phage prohead protease
MKNREVRTFHTTEMRVVRSDGEAPKIVGHAAVFDSPSKIGFGPWAFMETVKPGAFAKSIKEDDVRGLFNHDPNIVLGRNTAGTLELSEDDKGLAYTITPPETQWARDLLESIDRGDISGSSFGFEVKKQRWTEHNDEDDDALDERDLLELKLWDVSPVTFPAYPDTDVAKRQHEEFRASLETQQVETRKDDETRQDDEEHDWKAIPYSRHGAESTQDEDTPWDGPQVRADADVDQLKKISLFEDKEHLDIKDGFKGHHHQTDGAVNWNGVRSAMGVLRGARGGFTGIEDAELSKGYDHLVDHYKQFEKEAPENPFSSSASNSARMEMELRLRS